MTEIGEEIEVEIKIPSEHEEETPPEDDDELDADFEDFKKTVSEHKVVPEEETDERSVTNKGDEVFENIKLKIFMGLFFTLIDGVHLIIYKFISKYELEKEDLALDDTDKEGMQMYFQTPKIMNFINSIPVEIMGFIHLEWMYLQKYQDVVKVKEEEELARQKKIAILTKIKNKNNPPVEEEEEEEEEETVGSKDPPEEKPKRKYKKRKKKARKKAMPKKQEITEDINFKG